MSVDEFNGGNKAVAAAWDGFDVARVFGAIGKGVAEFADGGVQPCLKIDKRVFRPEVLFQLLASDHLALPFRQKRQHAQGFFLEADARSVLAYFPGCQVHKVRTELEHWRAGSLLHKSSSRGSGGLGRV